MKLYPPGTHIAGRYEIAGRPLIGGMGIVYVCLDHAEQRPVALKTFKPEYLPDRAARDRFLREGTAWVDLGSHPHIVRCHQVIYTDPEVYLVLELVAREEGWPDASLRSWLVLGRPLPAEQALLFALQVVRGMKHANATIPGFVHRDLKPENVLVGADRLSNADVNRVRVTDFGLVSVLQEAGGREQEADEETQGNRENLGRTQLTRGIVGTPLYMAPEQWKGERVDVQTDMYALGCILYEMLAGQRPVEGHSLVELEQAHCEGRLQPLPAGLPTPVGEVIACCLAIEPRARYGSWEAVEEALSSTYSETTGKAAPKPEPVEALELAEQVVVGWSYSTIGVSYLDIGKAEIAVGYFERAVEIGRKNREPRLESAGLTHLGVAYKHLGELQRAVEVTEQAMAIDREIGDRRGEGIDWGNLGACYKILGRLGEAMQCQQRWLAISRETSDWQNEAKALANLGTSYLDLGRLQEAVDTLQQALRIFQVIGDRRHEADTLGDLGICHQYLGRLDKALDFHQRQVAIARRIGDRQGEAYGLNEMGICYQNLGQLQDAVACLKEALAIGHEIGDRWHEGNALGNLGACYLLLGRLEEALCCQQEHLTIAKEIGDQRGEAEALANLGNCYTQMGRLGEAEQAWRASLAITEEIGAVLISANQYHNLALLLVQQGRLQEALPLAQRAAEISDQVSAPRALMAYTAQGYKPTCVASDPYRARTEGASVKDEAVLACNKANFLYQQGHLSRALDMYAHALSLDPTFVDAHYNMAVIQYDLALRSKGSADFVELMRSVIDRYELVLRLRQDDVDAMVNLAAAYRSCSELENPEREYELLTSAKELAPDYALVYLNLGHYFAKYGGMGDLQGKRDEIYAIGGAQVSINLGYLEQALEYYGIAVKLDPNLAELSCSEAVANLIRAAKEAIE